MPTQSSRFSCPEYHFQSSSVRFVWSHSSRGQNDVVRGRMSASSFLTRVKEREPAHRDYIATPWGLNLW